MSDGPGDDSLDRRRPGGVVGCALVFVLFLALHLDLQDPWWQRDDACLVASAARHGAAAHFLEAEVWRSVSPSFVTPWLVASLAADLALFGLSPTAFALHQAAAVALLLAGLYLALRRFTDRFGATAAVALAVTTVPVHGVAIQIMNRHYAEGALFCLAAVLLYVHGLRRRRNGLLWAAAACYGLATTAKEVFIPLVAALPLLPIATPRARLRALAPFLPVLLAAVFYRAYLLGPHNLLGGYLEGATARLAVTGDVGLAVWGLRGLVVVALMAACLRFARRWPRAVPSLVVALGAAVGPLWWVAGNLAPRHAFVPVLIGTVVVAGALDGLSLTSRRQRAVVVLGLLGLLSLSILVLEHSALRRERPERMQRARAEDRFLLDADRREVLVVSRTDPFHHACVVELREQVLGQTQGPGYCGDRCACPEVPEPATFVAYEDGDVVPTTFTPTSCDRSRPITVEMRLDAERGRLSYEFGPHRDGSYWLTLVHDGAQPAVAPALPVPASAEIPFQIDPDHGLRLEVEYRAEGDAWRTRTPTLELPRDGRPLLYRRGDAGAHGPDPAR